jgi:uncharacterized protein
MLRFSYTESMSTKPNLRKLAVLAFGKSEAELEGAEPLDQFERLSSLQQQDAAPAVVQFQARGTMRPSSTGESDPWLHLAAQTRLKLVCQRCLAPMEELVSFERDFRFVESEARAEREDEDSEEDVLALSNDFDLLTLVEDELLMALPTSPMHAVCPTELKLRVADPDFLEANSKPNPFAVLASLKAKP